MKINPHGAACKRQYVRLWRCVGLPHTHEAQRKVFRKRWVKGCLNTNGMLGCCEWHKRSRLLSSYLETAAPREYQSVCVSCGSPRRKKLDPYHIFADRADETFDCDMRGFCGACGRLILMAIKHRFTVAFRDDPSPLDEDESAHMIALLSVASLAAFVERRFKGCKP